MAATLSEMRDGVLIVRFVDTELSDEIRIREIGAELVELASQPGVKQLLLNFDGVSFMSSAMLGQLAILTKRCISHNVSLKMCTVAETMREVLRIVRLDTLAEILADEKEALKVFRRESRHKDDRRRQLVGCRTGHGRRLSCGGRQRRCPSPVQTGPLLRERPWRSPGFFRGAEMVRKIRTARKRRRPARLGDLLRLRNAGAAGL